MSGDDWIAAIVVGLSALHGFICRIFAGRRIFDWSRRAPKVISVLDSDPSCRLYALTVRGLRLSRFGF